MAKTILPNKSMQSTNLRNLIIIGLLGLGILAVYAPRYLAADDVVAPGNGEEPRYTYVSDLDFWQRTEREVTVQTTSRFDLDADLNAVPMQVGNWQGKDVPETNQEVMILLEPEQYVRRLYQDSQGRYLWLSMIGGRSSRPFHAPDICYDADGWQYDLGSHPVQLDEGGELYGLWLDAEKQLPDQATSTEQIVYYFYLFPSAQRDLTKGIVLFKLTSERYGSTEETLQMQAEFVRALFKQAG